MFARFLHLDVSAHVRQATAMDTQAHHTCVLCGFHMVQRQALAKYTGIIPFVTFRGQDGLHHIVQGRGKLVRGGIRRRKAVGQSGLHGDENSHLQYVRKATSGPPDQRLYNDTKLENATVAHMALLHVGNCPTLAGVVRAAGCQSPVSG